MFIFFAFIAQWWRNYRHVATNLQKLVIKILSLTCSLLGCEHNWNVFEQEIIIVHDSFHCYLFL